ncbi:I12R1 protein, partial [Rhinopomastus cyanomelas]|nr:I12R1 protein [Rhinopomastus cyanomelas]
SCWKKCQSHQFVCSWPPLGPTGNLSYLLTFCYVTPRCCQQFQVGMRTTYTLSRHDVYILTNTTAWVEASGGDQLYRTPNLTLYLREAIKPDPPPTWLPFTKTGGQLRLRVPRPRCHRGGQPPQREVRARRTGDRGWAQVTCEVVTGEDDSVTCALRGNGPFEVQLRHKLPHWSSYWSDWSGSIFIPEEILESPVLSYQLGQLGRDGQRVLRLGWQRAPELQGDVNYTLSARMLGCPCEGLDEGDSVVLGQGVTEHNLTLSGAEYEILLTAANAAGPGPPAQLRVPAEQHPDLDFKDISVAGGILTAQWQALTHGSDYCFEQLGDPSQGVCRQRDFLAGSIHVEKGKGAPQPTASPACRRLAVHGWDAERGWATFATRHHYIGNASLAVPVRINATAANATAVTLQWTPSPRAACPGALLKYLVCHAASGDNVTYGEADAGVSHYTLRNLRPGTVYRVGVREVTAESGGTCSAWWHFQTKALGSQGAGWRSNLKYLSISLGLPAAAAIYQLSKKRARHLLFSPLPKPMGSKAIEFSTRETSQGQPWLSFVEPSERFSSAKLLMLEPNPSEETPDPSTRPGTPQPSPAALCSPGCEELPFTYRKQEVLSPVGFLPPASSHSPREENENEDEDDEEEEDGRQEMQQPLVPIALLMSDKPVIIRDEEGWNLEKTVP